MSAQGRQLFDVRFYAGQVDFLNDQLKAIYPPPARVTEWQTIQDAVTTNARALMRVRDAIAAAVLHANVPDRIKLQLPMIQYDTREDLHSNNRLGFPSSPRLNAAVTSTPGFLAKTFIAFDATEVEEVAPYLPANFRDAVEQIKDGISYAGALLARYQSGGGSASSNASNGDGRLSIVNTGGGGSPAASSRSAGGSAFKVGGALLLGLAALIALLPRKRRRSA